jgi:hypothetical protein
LARETICEVFFKALLAQCFSYRGPSDYPGIFIGSMINAFDPSEFGYTDTGEFNGSSSFGYTFGSSSVATFGSPSLGMDTDFTGADNGNNGNQGNANQGDGGDGFDGTIDLGDVGYGSAAASYGGDDYGD